MGSNSPAKQAAQRIPDPHLTVRHVFATPAEAIGRCLPGLADAGVQYFIAGIDSSDEETSCALLAQASLARHQKAGAQAT